MLKNWRDVLIWDRAEDTDGVSERHERGVSHPQWEECSTDVKKGIRLYLLKTHPCRKVIGKHLSPGKSLKRPLWWGWGKVFMLLKLKLQYFGHLMWIAILLEETRMLGKTEDRRREGNKGWDGWMASPIPWTWTQANSRRWWRTGKPGVLQSTGSQGVGHDWVTEQQHGTPNETMDKMLNCSFFLKICGLIEVKVEENSGFL